MTPGRLVIGALLVGVVIALVINWLKPEPEGVWFGIGIFVFGWIITAAVTVRDRIKGHTFDLIFRTRFETIYLESARTVGKTFENIDVVDKTEAHRIFTSDDDKNIKVKRGVSILLNFYEVLSISVYYKDADERIIKEYFYDIMTSLYRQVQNFILLQRSIDPEFCVYLEWLNKRWGGEESAVVDNN